jgi:hypothetical protein
MTSDPWQFFLLERDEILRFKWMESQKAGYDIGLSRAIQIWLQRHRALWIAGLTAYRSPAPASPPLPSLRLCP